jgi:ribosomal protein S18 acetylase RimI-like enzyme
MAVHVLPAAEPDLPDIAALARVVWRRHYPGIISPAQIEYMLRRMYDLETLRAELAGGIRFDRLLVDGGLVGFSSYGPGRAPGTAKLHKLYVHPDEQRRGHGGRLLDHAEAVLAAEGYVALELAVNKANLTARAAYERHGFVVREGVKVDIGNGFVMDDFLMRKRLDAAVSPPR